MTSIAPLHLVVPFGPDGASDRVAQRVGKAFAARLGATLTVEHRPGEGGLAGLRVALGHPPQTTLVFGTTSTHAIAPALHARPDPDPARFIPLAMAGQAPNLVLARPGLAAGIEALLEIARRAPGSLAYASAGAGQTIHLCAERFARLAGVHLVHRPYAAGSRAGLEALARGEVDLMFDNVAAALDMVRAGKVVALAVAGASRSALFPGLPALGDLLPGYAADIWLGFFALPGTPPDILDTWRDALVAVLADPAVRADLGALGLDIDGRAGGDFGLAIADNARQWRHIVAECGLAPT